MNKVELAELFIRKKLNDDTIVVQSIILTPKDIAIKYELAGEDKINFFPLKEIAEFIETEKIEAPPNISESFYPKKKLVSKEDQILKERKQALRRLMSNEDN